MNSDKSDKDQKGGEAGGEDRSEVAGKENCCQGQGGRGKEGKGGEGVD